MGCGARDEICIEEMKKNVKIQPEILGRKIKLRGKSHRFRDNDSVVE